MSAAGNTASMHISTCGYPSTKPAEYYSVLVQSQNLAYGACCACGQHDGDGGTVAGEGLVGDEVIRHVLRAQLLGGLAVGQGIGLCVCVCVCARVCVGRMMGEGSCKQCATSLFCKQIERRRKCSCGCMYVCVCARMRACEVECVRGVKQEDTGPDQQRMQLQHWRCDL
eukprot:809104-Pelagomonas_calceolata.AAC.6